MRKKKRGVERYCVIQPTLRSDRRRFYEKEDNAIQHAIELVEGNGPWPNYRPGTLLVCRVTKVVAARGSARTLPTNLLETHDDE